VRSSNQAVFISYASEDSPAALRLCETLRAAGVEVWFDQSELRGGDAWDRQIKMQVHECALFIAVVSRHSNARTEGYFRREWRLAVERTHDIAEDAPFLLPVTIDDTTEGNARVPEQFREVQWTRLRDGATTKAFTDRVLRLLASDPAVTAPAALAVGAPAVATAAAPGKAIETRSAWWQSGPALLTFAVLLIGAGYLGVSQYLASRPGAPPAGAAGAATKSSTSVSSTVPEKSVAVLPFVNLSSDKEQEYFSDGLTEELINLLARIPELRVSARTSSFYFKGKPTMIADVAKVLGVTNILEGSVRKSGNTVRVTAQLIRADTGYPIWSDTYDRPLHDIFKIQDEIASSVINGLELSLLGGQRPRATQTNNTEAYSRFLQARSLSYFGSSPAVLERAIGELKQAVKLDPSFAPAWALLANLLSIESSLFGTIQLASAREEASAAAQKALALDPDLPEAHVAMGRLFYEVDWNWKAADAELQKAIVLEPGSTEPYRLAGYLATTQGRFAEALDLFKRAVAADPLQPWNYAATGYVAYRTGDLANAELHYKKALDLAPTVGKWHYLMGSSLLIRGQAAAALTEMQLETNDGFRQCGMALALDALGRKSEADAALTAAVQRYGGQKAYLIALIYAARHQPDQAFAWMERAIRQRDGDMLYIKGDPMIANLVSDPRYRLILQKMQLAD
jgi:TolB-like protein/tetratricopeptide (TPR) repeat protein